MVTILGKGFGEVRKVLFASREAAILHAEDSAIEVQVPAGDSVGAVDVSLVDAQGRKADFFDAFTYTRATLCTTRPKITALTPNSGRMDTHVDVSGENFVVDLAGSAIVSIGGERARYEGTVSHSTIGVAVPSLDHVCAGTCKVDVVAANPDGCSSVLEGGFLYGPPDSDGDGLSDPEESTYGTDPASVDTDGDGLHDGVEVHTYRTDPLAKDTDRDGRTDYEEVTTQPLTDPTNADNDGDGEANMTSGGTDCKDDDPTVYSTAPDVFGNGMDKNCKPDVVECQTTHALGYTAKVTFNPGTYTNNYSSSPTYDTQAFGGDPNWDGCLETKVGLSGDYQCPLMRPHPECYRRDPEGGCAEWMTCPGDSRCRMGWDYRGYEVVQVSDVLYRLRSIGKESNSSLPAWSLQECEVGD